MKKLIGLALICSFSVAAQVAPKVNLPKISPEEVKLYEQLPKKLTPADCAACHESIYNKMRKVITKVKLSNGKVLQLPKPVILGGKHRFYCTRCHTKFHCWNPKMGVKGWEEMMPKCSRCHGWPHGPKLTNCMSCHTDPHAIKQPMVLTTTLKKSCEKCHIRVVTFMETHVTKHFTKVKCYACHHDIHGYIPKCLECHEGHAPGQKSTSCTMCHGYKYVKAGEAWKAAHAPVPVTYPKNIPNESCGTCHRVIYNHLAKSPTKHRNVACVACHHDKHGYIPSCAECHGKYPHGKTIHQLYPNCLFCHLNPHDPAVPDNPHTAKFIKEEVKREKESTQILRKWKKMGIPFSPENLQKLPEF